MLPAQSLLEASVVPSLQAGDVSSPEVALRDRQDVLYAAVQMPSLLPYRLSALVVLWVMTEEHSLLAFLVLTRKHSFSESKLPF